MVEVVRGLQRHGREATNEFIFCAVLAAAQHLLEGARS